MLDCLEFERRGIPSTAILTEEFIPSAKAVLAMYGLPDYPFVLVRHPLKNLTRVDLQQRVDAALPQLEKFLTRSH